MQYIAGLESGGNFVTEEHLEVARNRAVQQASSRGKADRFVLSSATKSPPDSGPGVGVGALYFIIAARERAERSSFFALPHKKYLLRSCSQYGMLGKWQWKREFHRGSKIVET